jgi:hypothetical protein
MVVVSFRRSSILMVLLVASTNDIYPSAYLNNEKFIPRNKTSTNSYIQVFILYRWCVLHVMKYYLRNFISTVLNGLSRFV